MLCCESNYGNNIDFSRLDDLSTRVTNPRIFIFFRTLSHFSMIVVPVKFIDEMCAEGCEGNSRKEDGMHHFFLKA